MPPEIYQPIRLRRNTACPVRDGINQNWILKGRRTPLISAFHFPPNSSDGHRHFGQLSVAGGLLDRDSINYISAFDITLIGTSNYRIYTGA